MRKILDSIVMRYIYCRFPTMQSTHNTKKLKQPQSIWSVFFSRNQILYFKPYG